MKDIAWGRQRHLMASTGEPVLCWPLGFTWNHRAVVHFIVPGKVGGRVSLELIEHYSELVKIAKGD